MRALEAEIGWTFPAIKKQVDALDEAGIITIDKDQNKWSIIMHEGVQKILRDLFLVGLKNYIATPVLLYTSTRTYVSTYSYALAVMKYSSFEENVPWL